MTAPVSAALAWWTLPVPTVDGRTTLDCLSVADPHRAAVVPAGRAALCASCRRPCTGHVWADLARTVLLCGPCHERRHAGDDTPAPAPDPDQVPGQATLDDFLS